MSIHSSESLQVGLKDYYWVYNQVCKDYYWVHNQSASRPKGLLLGLQSRITIGSTIKSASRPKGLLLVYNQGSLLGPQSSLQVGLKDYYWSTIKDHYWVHNQSASRPKGLLLGLQSRITIGSTIKSASRPKGLLLVYNQGSLLGPQSSLQVGLKDYYWSTIKDHYWVHNQVCKSA